MTMYAHAPDVAHIAGDLIATIPDHADLAGVDVIYVWRDKATKTRGRTVLGKARKVSGLHALLARDLADDAPLFVVEIAQDEWIRLTTKQRYALVDHELSHLRVKIGDDGERDLSVRGHDVEEFRAVIERHGLWKDDVADFAVSASEQLRWALDDLALGDGDEG